MKKPGRNLIRVFSKVHRNDLCPCGSGQKVKNCQCVNVKNKDDLFDLRTNEVIHNGTVIGVLREKGKEV